MPVYCFLSDDGETLEHYFSMADAPSVGATIRIKGKRYKRDKGLEDVKSGFAWQPYTSRRLPLNSPHAPKVDGAGRPIFETQHQEREFCAKYADQGTPYERE